jgi:hypothetical protein
MLKTLYRMLHPGIQKLFLDYPVDFRPRYGHGLPPHPELYALINRNRTMYEALLRKALELSPAFAQIPAKPDPAHPERPSWVNGFFPGLDTVALFTLMVEYKPARYVEVGSGNSTRVAHFAKTSNGLTTHITSIDPAPRAEMDALADTIVRRPFEQTDFADVLNLERNDMLFIDNSHRMLPNSDATVFFLEILPRLKPGVLVHVHDVYLPYDYPQFMCDRFYSEQYGLAIALQANPGRYVPLFPNYFISEDAALSALLEPVWKLGDAKQAERHGGSFWLQIGEE